MTAPALSIILPVFNCARYLDAALESVRNQTFSDFECIVVDDGSSDRSLAIMQRQAKQDARIRIISRENRGLVASLNEAISVARGTFLGRMDGDDICVADRFSRQISVLNQSPHVVGIGAAVDMVDSEGKRLKTYTPPEDHSEIVSELRAGNGGAMIHPVVTFRMDAVREIGGYRECFSGFGEDWDLFLRLSEIGGLRNLPDILLKYRQHPKSYCRTRKASQRETLLKAVEQVRRKHQLPEFSSATPHEIENPRRQWVLWSLEGAERITALKHAVIAVLQSPEDRRAWSLLVFVFRCLLIPETSGVASRK